MIITRLVTALRSVLAGGRDRDQAKKDIVTLRLIWCCAETLRHWDSTIYRAQVVWRKIGARLESYTTTMMRS